jgi:hypothetical protein
MSTAAQQIEQHDDTVWTTLPLTAHEARTLDLVLITVMEKPGTFGVRGNGSTEVKRILIATAGGLRDKLGTPPPVTKPKPARKRPVTETEPTKKETKVAPAVPAVAFSPPVVAPAPAVERPEPAAVVEPTPAVVEPTPAAPATTTNGTRSGGTKHYLIVYSLTKNKPVAELVFDSYEEAFGARSTEAAQWTDQDDVVTHVISGPNRKVLVSAQPKFFRARPPKARVGG